MVTENVEFQDSIKRLRQNDITTNDYAYFSFKQASLHDYKAMEIS